jgi:hypothetical protein
MDQGFLLELKDGNQKAASEWIEGAPQKAWYGLNVRGKRRLRVDTWRCGRCTYLESYAPDA